MATGIVVVLALATAIIGRIEPMTSTLAFASTGLCAMGTLIVAAYMALRGAYPRWSWWTSAGVLVLALLLSVVVAPSVEVWNDDVRQMAWLLPWTLVIMGITSPMRIGREPADRHGWILVGMSAVLSIILLGVSAIDDATNGLFA
jgi:uncharacterized membrane protein YuzA (DUF378 family)